MTIVRELFGRRVASLRVDQGWTQSDLADRLGISRVAVSHLETGQSVASERTVTLLAGLLKLEPHELVSGTDYPPAKAERLPLVTARYTEVDHHLALLDAALGVAGRVPAPAGERLAAAVRDEWWARLGDLLARCEDPGERDRLRAVRAALSPRR